LFFVFFPFLRFAFCVLCWGVKQVFTLRPIKVQEVNTDDDDDDQHAADSSVASGSDAVASGAFTTDKDYKRQQNPSSSSGGGGGGSAEAQLGAGNACFEPLLLIKTITSLRQA
jgi:hypothetical protein